MLKEINTKEKKNIEEFEARVVDVYNRYKEVEVSKEYVDLWNIFVEMIEFIQENTASNEQMSPKEVLLLMKEMGFSQEDLKDLIKTGINK